MEKVKNLIIQNSLDLSFLVDSYKKNTPSVRKLNILRFNVKEAIKDRNDKIGNFFFTNALGDAK